MMDTEKKFGDVPIRYKDVVVPLKEGDPRLVDLLPEFVDHLKNQLMKDEERWGSTWLNLPKEGQESRIMEELDQYHTDFKKDGTPIPWLRVAGNALIAWLRENKPELSDKW
jgi:hypothetical protein